MLFEGRAGGAGASEISPFMNTSFAASPATPTPALLARGGVGGALAGVAAAVLTVGAAHWYGALVKPIWAPSPVMLGVLQVAVALATSFAWAHLAASRAPQARRDVVMAWFWAQLALGLAWSAAFWAGHSQGWGYALVFCWWIAISALMWTGSRLSKTAFWLLVPVWLWTTFASSLNFAVLSFNVMRETSAAMDADPRNANSPADPPIIIKKR